MEAINKLILAFVTLIVGAVLISQVATTGLEKTSLVGVNNELKTLVAGTDPKIVNTSQTYTVANAPTGWKIQDCPLTNFVLANSTGAALTATTDYTVSLSAGTFKLKNTVGTNNSAMNTSLAAYASYNYCPDDYMNSSWGRTVINLVPGFFGLAILLVSVGLFYSIAKDYGILN